MQKFKKILVQITLVLLTLLNFGIGVLTIISYIKNINNLLQGNNFEIVYSFFSTAFLILIMIFVIPIACFYALEIRGKKYNVFSKDIIIFFSFTALYSLIAIISAMFGILIGYDGEKINGILGFNIYILMTAVLQIIIFTYLILLFYRKDYMKQIREFFKSPNIFIINFAKIMMYFILAILIQIVFGIIATQLFPGVEGEANQNALEGMMKINPTSIGFFIMVVISGPFVEEFFFRFVLIEKLLYKLPKLLIIIVGTLIFSFMHAQAADSLTGFIHDLITYSGMSLVLCSVYVYERNILFTLAVHMGNNFLAYIGMIAAISQMK